MEGATDQSLPSRIMLKSRLRFRRGRMKLEAEMGRVQEEARPYPERDYIPVIGMNGNVDSMQSGWI